MYESILEDPKVTQIVDKYSRKVYNLDMEQEDIKNELYLSIIEDMENCGVPEKTNYGRITIVVKRKIYRLIKSNISFEGCSEAGKNVRHAISKPISLDKIIGNNGNFDEFITLLSIIVDENSIDFQYKIEIESFIKYFISLINAYELSIFTLMIDGINKPRYICKNLYGHTDKSMCKVISKDMILIKQKFIECWKEEYGKIIKVR